MMGRSWCRRVIEAALLWVPALALGACSPEALPPEATRPNVVLIIIDTLRADKLSSYGAPPEASPALTRFAEQGVQFDHVISQSSWTLPSVASMLTSRYPRTLGLYIEGSQILATSHLTLAEILHDHGYATFGITANPHLNAHFNFDQGFDDYEDGSVIFAASRELVPEGRVFYQDAPFFRTVEVFERTLSFAKQWETESPRYIQMNIMEVHEFRVPQLIRPEYLGRSEELPRGRYLRMVRQVTDDLERFVEELSALPGWHDTLFIFTSDHGEGMADHPSIKKSHRHGELLYETLIHVPLILYNPSWQPARRHVEQRVRLLDLVPTLLEHLGIPAPEHLEGSSLMPLVEGTGEAVELPEFFISETYFRGADKITAHGERWQYFHNRSDYQGLPEHELQSRGGNADGKKTDQSARKPGQTARMRRFVHDWEQRHEKAPPTLLDRDLSDAERDQLRALGYLE